jgi:hypothetical protein
MTVLDLGSTILRRWYVVVVALIFAAFGGYLLQGSGGLYTSETVVSFLLPKETSLSPNSGLDDTSVIAFSGVVARAAGSGRAPVNYSTDDAPLYGAGLRQGVVLALPNSGNQWSTAYLRAELVLRIVGPTKEWVAQQQDDVLTRIIQVADAQQFSVASEDARIQVSPVPLTKQIFHIAPSRSETIAAFLALLIAAFIVGAWGAVLVDRAIRGNALRSKQLLLQPVADERLEY